MSIGEYKTLPTAKKLLNSFRENYLREIESTSSELRPDWSKNGRGGYNYGDIEDKDIRFIYETIGTLGPEIDSSLFDFDVEKEFISPKKAVEYLIDRYELIKKEMNQLYKLKSKYTIDNLTPYPIMITIHYHEKTIDILEEVLKLKEIQDVLNPGFVERIIKENIDLKFEKKWKRLYRKYLWQVFLFVIFLATVIVLLFYRTERIWIGVIVGLIPIANSFISKTSIKDSFKAIFSPGFKTKKHEEYEKAQQVTMYKRNAGLSTNYEHFNYK